MAEPQDLKSFTVVYRNFLGEPLFIYPWDGSLAACVTLPTNIARDYLNHADIQAALLSFAKGLHPSIPNPWYKDPRHGYKTMKDVVREYVSAILEDFPTICIDDSILNPKCLATSYRHEWDGRFQPRDYSICLNAGRMRDMVIAFTKAKQIIFHGKGDNEQTCKFVFLMANVIFQELCHIFVTFLTRGLEGTPRQLKAELQGWSPETGAAGRYVENRVFGGTTAFYRDFARDRSQSGTPCLLTEKGARQISKETIIGALNHRYLFPFRLEGPLMDPSRLEALGKHDGPVGGSPDPMNYPLMNRLKKYRHGQLVDDRDDFHRSLFRENLSLAAPGGVLGNQW